jgi:hypothetical protein
MIIAGAGLTIKQYFTNLGDIAIISALTFCFAASFIYCFIKGAAFASTGKIFRWRKLRRWRSF